jgi:hypothetical protein
VTRALSVITRDRDLEMARIQGQIAEHFLVEDRGDLEALMCRWLADGTRATSLDLIGHSNSESLLVLGTWTIDASKKSVCAFFRELADHDVLPRLGIDTVRLLGCQTAVTRQARATLGTLADILGVGVLGTTELVYSAHYDRGGFRAEHAHILAGATLAPARAPRLTGERFRRVLDIDSLPVSPLATTPVGWPRRIATTAVAREILQLVRRADGAQMPGLLRTPDVELAVPATDSSWYYTLQVLLDGQFVRVFPDGLHNPGIVFPVSEPERLRALVSALSS